MKDGIEAAHQREEEESSRMTMQAGQWESKNGSQYEASTRSRQAVALATQGRHAYAGQSHEAAAAICKQMAYRCARRWRGRSGRGSHPARPRRASPRPRPLSGTVRVCAWNEDIRSTRQHQGWEAHMGTRAQAHSSHTHMPRTGIGEHDSPSLETSMMHRNARKGRNSALTVMFAVMSCSPYCGVPAR